MWSVIQFISPEYNVSESAGVIRVPVVKKGNLKQVIYCCVAVTLTYMTHDYSYQFIFIYIN